jgi:hypothetical protein
LLHDIGHDANFGDSGAELLGGAVEALGPVADFVGFVDAVAVAEDDEVGEIAAFELYTPVSFGEVVVAGDGWLLTQFAW